MRLFCANDTNEYGLRSAIAILSQGQKVYAQLVTLDGEQQEIIQR